MGLAKSKLFCGPCVLCVVNSVTVVASCVAESRWIGIFLKGKEGGKKQERGCSYSTQPNALRLGCVADAATGLRA